jgi:hypothetical protein
MVGCVHVQVKSRLPYYFKRQFAFDSRDRSVDKIFCIFKVSSQRHNYAYTTPLRKVCECQQDWMSPLRRRLRQRDEMDDWKPCLFAARVISMTYQLCRLGDIDGVRKSGMQPEGTQQTSVCLTYTSPSPLTVSVAPIAMSVIDDTSRVKEWVGDGANGVPDPRTRRRWA